MYQKIQNKKVLVTGGAGFIGSNLRKLDPKIAKVEIVHGRNRAGDLLYSLASVVKAKGLLGYEPTHKLTEWLISSLKWYCKK